MTTFEHITEKEILYAAYHNLLERYGVEEKINQATRAEHGRDNRISVHRMKQLDIQLDEIHTRILELEKV